MNEKGENPDAEPSGETPVCPCDCHEDGAGCCPTCYEFWAMIGRIRVERDELAKLLRYWRPLIREAIGLNPEERATLDRLIGKER
jgi:hypothetical protein